MVGEHSNGVAYQGVEAVGVTPFARVQRVRETLDQGSGFGRVDLGSIEVEGRRHPVRIDFARFQGRLAGEPGQPLLATTIRDRVLIVGGVVLPPYERDFNQLPKAVRSALVGHLENLGRPSRVD